MFIYFKKMKNIGDSTIQSLNASINNSLMTQIDHTSHEIKKDSFNANITNKYEKKIKTRKLNSLEIITRKFIQSVIAQKTHIINLKKIAEIIKVHRRRIYDITNVLEGK